MYFVGINAGGQVSIILLTCGPCVVIVNCWNRFCTLGRAPRTKETLLDFHEWCRVTRHPRVFHGLIGYQQTPGFWGVTSSFIIGIDLYSYEEIGYLHMMLNSKVHLSMAVAA